MSAAWPKGFGRRFYDNLDRTICVQPAPWSVVTDHVVTYLDKMLYNDYLNSVTSNKQQIYEGRSQTLFAKPGIRSTPKWVRICLKQKSHRRFLESGG